MGLSHHLLKALGKHSDENATAPRVYHTLAADQTRPCFTGSSVNEGTTGNRPSSSSWKDKSSETRNRNYVVPQIHGNIPDKLPKKKKKGIKEELLDYKLNKTDQQCWVCNYVRLRKAHQTENPCTETTYAVV